GPGRPAWAVAQAARAGDHQQLRAPGLPADAAGLLRPRPARQQGPAYPAPAGRGAVLAPAVPRYGDDEGLSAPAARGLKKGGQWPPFRSCVPGRWSDTSFARCHAWLCLLNENLASRSVSMPVLAPTRQ